MARPYWEEEQPVEITSGRNRLRWFRKAGRLHVSLPDWQTGEGETRPGKTVALNIDALRESDDVGRAREVFEEIVSMLKLP